MAFKDKSLTVLAYSNGFTLWHYHTPDREICTRNYFAAANNLLQDGDFVFVNHGNGTSAAHCIYFVISDSKGQKTLTPLSG